MSSEQGKSLRGKNRVKKDEAKLRDECTDKKEEKGLGGKKPQYVSASLTEHEETKNEDNKTSQRRSWRVKFCLCLYVLVIYCFSLVVYNANRSGGSEKTKNKTEQMLFRIDMKIRSASLVLTANLD